MIDLPKRLVQLFNRYPNISDDDIALVYAKSAIFEDPVTRIEGLENISAYFRKMYQGVVRCRFEGINTIESGDHAAISWIMRLEHKSLNNGNSISLNGCSIIQYSDRILYHRDYFDLGEMIYENIPLLRSIIKHIKNRIH